MLVDRVVRDDRVAELRERAGRLPAIALAPREAADLDLVASGAASPLGGFMGLRDYRSVLDRLRLADGTPWPVPVTLAVTVAEMASALPHRAATLVDSKGRLRAVIEVSDAFVRDPREEARALYTTDDPAHPGVAYLLSRPTGTLGGQVHVLPAVGPRPSSSVLPRDLRARARRERWTGLRGVATTDGSGCLEPTGASRPALLPVPRVAVRRSPGRDAFLQAIVLKNFGANEVIFEYQRADWLAASPEVAPEDLGITPLWFITPERARVERRVAHA
jgi:sulfate adenylyltransferase